MKALLKQIRRAAAGIFGALSEVLKEVFDEAAYARYLSRAGIVSSREAYAAFRRECEHGHARRPRCC
jgi:hypothetical protein